MKDVKVNVNAKTVGGERPERQSERVPCLRRTTP